MPGDQQYADTESVQKFLQLVFEEQDDSQRERTLSMLTQVLVSVGDVRDRPTEHQKTLYRTISEQGNQNRAGLIVPGSARYKTELCRQFVEHGFCNYGNKCQFAHGESEIRSLNRHPKYKTEMCRSYHTTGFCAYGHRCHFIHNDDEQQVAPEYRAIDSSRIQIQRSVSVVVDTANMQRGRPILSRSVSTTQ